ncbi:MAG: CooT family nickel-binding protein [Candidatus Bathyarchaeia archaeon]
MCEFKVYIVENEGMKKIAEEIIKAKFEDGHIELSDILGSSKRVDDALIEEINVNKECLLLRRILILPEVMNFLRIHKECEEKGVYMPEIETAWEEVKAKGDELIKKLWNEFGRKKLE